MEARQRPPREAATTAPHVPPLSVRALRKTRPLHRYVGVPLTVLILVSAVTGTVLAWKKNSATLQPPTQTGASTDLVDWRPWSEVEAAAVQGLAAHLGGSGDPVPEVDRYDVRPGDGIVKVQFQPGNWEVQVDPTTLRVHWVARRHSDWIETVHDLSIISDLFKLVTMNALGVGLVVLSLSGLWLWYGPRWVRGHKQTGG